jgi:3alpha(or 20beta)-hydroxysteroid dehydrogenase
MSLMASSPPTLLLTGGARGIGAATARLFAARGAKVMLTDVIDDEGRALSASLGERVRYAHLDVTSERAWREVVAETERTLGPITALFNNAGVLGFGSVLACAPEDFDRVLAVNLRGVFLGLHVGGAALKRAGGGVIVNNSSTAGLQGYGGLAAYVASKWAVRGLSKAAALDLAPFGVRVVSLHPGPIRTPMTAGLAESIASAQPIPRFGEADEVARMVHFLVTEATYSTGSEFVVDGGAVTGQVLPLPEA